MLPSSRPKRKFHVSIEKDEAGLCRRMQRAPNAFTQAETPKALKERMAEVISLMMGRHRGRAREEPQENNRSRSVRGCPSFVLGERLPRPSIGLAFVLQEKEAVTLSSRGRERQFPSPRDDEIGPGLVGAIAAEIGRAERILRNPLTSRWNQPGEILPCAWSIAPPLGHSIHTLRYG
jgi:hypothetical protein